MRVVVTGATGNVGSALVPALAARPEVDEIVGVARRPPSSPAAKVRWVAADITRDELGPHFRGAAAVVHLVWIIQPSRDPERQRRVNIGGLERVLHATRTAGVGRLVHISSVGAYSPAPRDHPIDESWPTDGMAMLAYSWQKAYAERRLENFAAEHAACRAVRIRPSLVMQRSAGREVTRYFLGRLVPARLIPPDAMLTLLDRGPIALQTVHATDLAEAIVLAACSDITGALNVAGPGLVGVDRPLIQRGAALLAGVTYATHLQPTGPGWVQAAARLPLMDTGRLERELGWRPRWSGRDALRDLLVGIHEQRTAPTPALS